ncbi:SDR family oxidoreductase [Paraburkholderia caribensis]|uniref:3-oxoacyl-ACP reductase n=1 Tax=Paraburkholderia caribensis TaxID=75105 RepID=A0A9Q6S8H6_9BURK|nr:SDR family oxidoreductase [Paraburkholderia caribensis]MCO4880097.1 SDR family oxidoreductase [Paraburkholderia caribensis]PTB26278.1 short chain dehydrogenase [Paraburkholderia caribensis]QLB66104.1 3-oxoacyl-ACP reductase [Paraburkholderia caribensis]
MGALQGKIAIVTGAASGFGAQISRRYVEQGAQVVIADLNIAAGEMLAAELGDNATAILCDVTKSIDITATVRTCVETFGVPDVVVNNAGTTHRNQPMLGVDEETFDRVYAVNIKSIYHMAHAVVPLMRERKKGVILNVGSVAGIRPRPGLTWYNGSKGAVNMLSKSMAVELAPDNIRVNAICPVMGATALLEHFMGVPDTPENRARFIASIPLGRLCEPDDVAQVAVFLATDGAAYLTGLEVPVDGGRTI